MTDPLHEEIVASELLYQGRLLTLRRNTVRMANGHVSTRETVEHPGAVAMVPLCDDGRVLLVRQWRTAAGRPLLEIPAGTLAPGEEPQACAERELMEEVGCRPGRLTPIVSFYLAPGYSTEILHVFLAEMLIPERRPHDEDEAIEVVAASWGDIEIYIQAGEIGDAKSLAGLLMVRRLLDR
jgi:ADP-ribose pyrophosphatase